MTQSVIVTTAESSTADAAASLLATASQGWPEADLKVLVSARLANQQEGWDATSVETVCPERFVVSRVLDEGEQLALALPRLMLELLNHYETCVFIGPGLLIVRPPDALVASSRTYGVAVSVPATVMPAHSLTPSLGPIEAGPFLPDARCVAVSRAGIPFLNEWVTTLDEAVLDVDQRPLWWAGNTLIRRAPARSDVFVEGESTFLDWSDYAAVEAGRSSGPDAAIVACDALFATAREQHLADDPEVEWSMLVHRVHDSRPVEPLLQVIHASQSARDRYSQETPFDLVKASVWRAADPFGHRWGISSSGEFQDWLFAENEAGCTRIADLLIHANPELLERFPRARLDPAPFKEWVDERLRMQMGFDPFDSTYRSRKPEKEDDEEAPGGLKNALAWRWQTLKTLVPGSAKRATKRIERRYLGPDPADLRGLQPPVHVPVTQATPMWGATPRDLNLIGPFRSESGLGQAARASLEALRLIGRSFSHIDTTEKYPSRNAVDVGLDYSTYGQLGDVNLIHTNADEMITLAEGAFKHRFGGRFNAAMWFWEAADLPKRSRPAFHLVDELWVASDYLRDVFGQYAQVPIHVIGLAADLPKSREVDRARYGWSDDDLVFLFVYDALSSYGRKNPRKALDAFVAAFAPKFEGVRFVLKVSNLNKFPASQKELLGLAERYPAITIIDQYLPRDDVMDLMTASDVYVSLHAAEGFGLTLLESMALGTPVICTGYSGNMDFTNEENSWLVEYDMMATSEPTGPYPKGSIWASPRLDDAIETMKYVRTHRDEVVVKAEKARKDALEAASLERYAKRLDQHLRRVL